MDGADVRLGTACRAAAKALKDCTDMIQALPKCLGNNQTFRNFLVDIVDKINWLQAGECMIIPTGWLREDHSKAQHVLLILNRKVLLWPPAEAKGPGTGLCEWVFVPLGGCLRVGPDPPPLHYLDPSQSTTAQDPDGQPPRPGEGRV